MDPDKSCNYCKTWVTRKITAYACRNNAFFGKSRQILGKVKPKAPYSKGQGKGAAVDPMSSIPISKYKDLVRTLMSQAVSLEVKHKVMQRAVSQCPAMPMDLLGQQVPSLLDSGSMVTLIREEYFIKYIHPLLNKSSSKLADTHSMFQLSAANNEIMPVSKYLKLT